ncbi:MAG: hypothetical protein A2X49_03835 [Lentisphaerae bacterium GWF2_52_8]|nr:MAG: hypothetical protein A2X49_03835 [Lentisphaerae bacterium GWF2_52_8]
MKHRKTSALFTLVELLVVITIIMLLAGLLLPALKKTREMAKKISCISNQKQLAMGMQMYVGENKDLLPAYNPDGNTYIASEGGKIIINATLMNLDKPETTPSKWMSIFLCSGSFRDKQSSYATQVLWWDATRKVTKVKRPSAKAFGFDGPTRFDLRNNTLMTVNHVDNYAPGAGSSGGVLWTVATNTNNYKDFIYGRHGLTANAWFVDGHVQSFSAQKLTTDWHNTRTDAKDCMLNIYVD